MNEILTQILEQKNIIHISGIGGIGMSGIAVHLKNLGFETQGSDAKHNTNIEKLEQLGIKTFTPQSDSNLKNISIIIKSSAIKDSNPEILYAKKNDIPIISRAEILKFLMNNKTSIAITGAHGKTSSSAMMSFLLHFAQKDPSCLVGGILNDFATNAFCGNSDLFVTEADESDGTINILEPTYSIVTNIDYEHMDFYKTFENVKSNFKNFIKNTSKISYVYDDQSELYELSKSLPNVVYYGESERSQIKLLKYNFTTEGSVFDFSFNEKLYINYKIKSIGKHNVLNCLPVIACAKTLNLSDEIIRDGIFQFTGVQRRFTRINNDLGVTVIDDYAHHPNEIKAVLKTAKYVTKGKIFAIVQLHRFSRFQSLFQDFCNIATLPDYSYFTPIYAAGEENTQNISHQNLIDNVKNKGFKNIDSVSDINDLSKKISSKISKGDIILFLGAGNITQWAKEFPIALQNEINCNNAFSQNT